jgi:hypothetical protein
MKKLLLSLIVMLSTSVFATDNSVYAWGPWAEGIKPAAGPVYVAPAPVSELQVDMREAIELQRQFNDIQYVIAPPAVPGAPQVSGIVGCSPTCPSGSGGLGGGGSI